MTLFILKCPYILIFSMWLWLLLFLGDLNILRYSLWLWLPLFRASAVLPFSAVSAWRVPPCQLFRSGKMWRRVTICSEQASEPARRLKYETTVSSRVLVGPAELLWRIIETWCAPSLMGEDTFWALGAQMRPRVVRSTGSGHLLTYIKYACHILVSFSHFLS